MAGTRQGRDTTRFEHRQHESVSCTTCHTADVQHGALRTRVARDCAGCHHGNTAVGRACERCHERGELAAPHSVSTTLSLTVWTAPRTRSLAFAHDRHARIGCAECHAANAARSVEKSCTSCHADHHQAARSCTACHASARATHTRALHVTGCGGSGCHVRETTAAVTPVRSVCLTCHAEQVDHKPGRECAGCHLSSWRATAPGS
jgi:hypothetical protein